MSDMIVLMIDDLMFLPRLESGLSSLGYQTITATNETELTRALFQSPVLVIVDLFSRKFDWEALIGLIKKSKAGPVPVLGFGPHVDLQLREKALAAGCDAVVGRGAVATNLAHLVEKHKWVLDKQPCDDTAPALLIEGLELFNQGDYFESHEVIEQAWMEERGPVRIMYQGVLQIGVACHHIRNKNWRGAMKLLERGIPKVRRFSPSCMGLNLANLLADAEAIRQELIRLGSEWNGEFNPALYPTVKYETAPPIQKVKRD
jgi:CheY-like chemotaxis protein